MESKRTLGMRLMEGWMHLHGRLPLGYHRWWGRVLGAFLQNVLHYRVDVVYTNLSRSFPEKSYKEIRSIAKQFYRHLGTVFTTMLWFGACRGDKGRKRLKDSHIVDFVNAAELQSLFSPTDGKPRQVMVLSSHTGNWELLGGVLQYNHDQPSGLTAANVIVTYKRLSNHFFDGIMGPNRMAPVLDIPEFTGYVETDKVMRFVLERKNVESAYFFITDQYPYWDKFGTMPVEFMHQSTLSLTGAARLANKLDMSLCYLRFRYRENGNFTMEFVPMASHASTLSPEAIMQAYYRLLEEDLQAQPWNYLWTHKRWK